MVRSLRSNSTAPDLWQPQPMAENPSVVAQLAPSTVTWTEDPQTDDFNPGTTAGNKIFNERSRGHPDGKLFSNSFKDAKDFQVFLRSRSVSLGPAVTHVPVAWNDDNEPTEFKNIITQYQTINIDAVLRAAHKRHGIPLASTDPIPPAPWNAMEIDPAANAAHQTVFHDRVRGNVVNKFLDNTLDPASLDSLRLEKDKFTFIDRFGKAKEDGPTKLLLLLQSQDPSTIVNIENHRTVIETIKLQDYQNNVKDMIADIQKHYKVITDNNGEYGASTYRRHVFNALQSGPNAKFNAKISAIQAEVESGIGHHKDITPSELLLAANTYYTNLVSLKKWDEVDPKDARILALTTELAELRKTAFSTQAAPATSKPVETKPGMISGTNVAEWRTKFVGETLERNGETWKWCSHHKQPGKWEGLYWKDHCTATHDTWHKDRAAKRRNGGTKPPASTSVDKPPGEPKKLEVTDKLKTALATRLCVSEEDIARIMEESGN